MWQGTFNEILSFGTILLQIALLAGILIALLSPEGKAYAFLKRHAALFSFLIALSGMAMSLVYSEIIGYAPCELCWYQRICIYPLVILFGAKLTAKEKSRSLWWSALALSVIGLLISIYQYVGSEFFPGSLACAASAVSCAKIYFTDFGYITIPMMALTSLAAIVFLTVISRAE